MYEVEYGQESEVSLLELLVVVAENLKLLILGPIVVGLLTLGVAYFLPQKFVSQSILTVPAAAQAAAMMVSPLVLDQVVESLNLAAGRPIQDARITLAKQVNTAVGKDGLLRLDASADTPALAQNIANAVIDVWLKSTVPGQQDRADLEKRLAYATASLKSLASLFDRLVAEGPPSLNKALTRGDAGMSMVTLGELQARYLAEVLNVSRLLRGLSRDVVLQPPTLPSQPVAPRKSLIAVLAALGCGLLLLLWVFVLAAWKNAAQNPQAAEKQARLRSTLGFKVDPL